MSLIFTTSWARQLKSQKDWDLWLSKLSDGDDVLYQQFIPKGKGCLDSKIECWRFWPAKIIAGGTRVLYDNDDHPLKNGIATYWDSDAPHGDVFGSRIVPVHKDISPGPGCRFTDAHAPIFEPSWDDADRCYVLVRYGLKTHKASHAISKSFPHQYAREVNGGRLHTVFAEADTVELFCKNFTPDRLDCVAPVFLYSEPTYYG